MPLYKLTRKVRFSEVQKY